jgi:hypothetical protein
MTEEAGIGAVAISDAAISGSQFVGEEIAETPFYDYPIGRGLESDYGIRRSKMGRHKYIIGRR